MPLPIVIWWDFPVPLPGVVLFRMSLATFIASSFVPSKTFTADFFACL